MSQSAEAETAYAALSARAAGCRRCPRMEGRRRVLGAVNGPLGARALFVAEAPGRLGADRTGVPLSGDQSGRNFAALLAASGLRRDEVFVTNAVLCNPRDAQGRNAPPSPAEIRSCSGFLRETIAVVDPLVVVALGASALRALALLAPHELRLARDVARPARWGERWLVALYHPSPRAQLHRPFGRQLDDFRALGSFLASLPES
ncbi:MAG TPA: uracil-DNA glycosylase [Thermomicrobiaceae bacterium]|nr:uracil-DNA glycosylase [Thermomicrobiaceae bacterium]